MKAERRFIRTEVRATEGESPKIAGHAALFNVRSQDLGGFVEIIAPSAFDECLASNPDILGLFNHDMMAIPLGRTTSGTLRVNKDAVGLAYEIDPPDTQLARDLVVSLRRKDVSGSSFGFYCLDNLWDFDSDNDILVRTVLKASVFDVSPVTNPAYLQTDAAIRSELPQFNTELRDLVAAKRLELTGSAGRGDADERGTASRLELLLHYAGR